MRKTEDEEEDWYIREKKRILCGAQRIRICWFREGKRERERGSERERDGWTKRQVEGEKETGGRRDRARQGCREADIQKNVELGVGRGVGREGGRSGGKGWGEMNEGRHSSEKGE